MLTEIQFGLTTRSLRLVRWPDSVLVNERPSGLSYYRYLFGRAPKKIQALTTGLSGELLPHLIRIHYFSDRLINA